MYIPEGNPFTGIFSFCLTDEAEVFIQRDTYSYA